ncbi:MAG: UDP-N-acetylmuramoyl-tripeptide--D-alanyl-D-alanine ligase [Bacillota bacterium]|jgi:UDP-N-acetylmuramoyl-tripeptide--D-alanyl-D-alanine ligase|nr:UDP-N-acetylmuramoyl-tripeptide--D-alanyl-D-alanine ligase [Bacillota bacterium]
MKNMTLLNIAIACKGKLFPDSNYPMTEVKGIVIDSRLVKKDYLFIATKGERVDGHDYIESAISKGAMAVVCQRPPSSKIPYILVDDSLLALKDIASWYRMQLDIPIVAITGSVGKTSSKEFVSSVLSQKFSVLKTQGNYNNEIGLPLTILQIRKDHEIAVLEMGINDFGEMHRLSKIAKPDYCLITNIGECHLEKLGSRQGVLKAKSEIFDFMGEDGVTILNGDDDLLSTIKNVKDKTPIRYGFSKANSVYADKIISNGLLGSTCDIHIGNKLITVNIPMPGNHMILNALAAASIGMVLGLSNKEITLGIEQIKPVSGRNNIIKLKKYTVIDDCYNANPVSMKAAIDLLLMANTRKVAILGDMGELGQEEDELNKEIGIYAANKNVNIIICVGKLSSYMYDGAKEVLGNNQDRLFYFKTKEDLLKMLPDILEPGDTILIKASHFMAFDRLVKAIENDTFY